jgi:archaellum biogenesis ATPase FlaH
LLQKLESHKVDSIRAEIRNEFQSEFDNLHQISTLNDKNTILLLTQPLASDGIVESVEKQVQFYMENIQQLQAAGFRVFCKLHPRDVANQISYPIEPSNVFHFSSPMELFEEELRDSFVGIATYSSTSFAESTKFARISLSLW